MRQLSFVFFAMLFMISADAQLIINELSQGPSGTKEYVELLVTGNPVCGGSNTVDLRGWIIDDNNSWHGAGAGTGIAGGHVRFANINQWASVKIGTLILIYNDADVSPAVAALAVDTSDSNNDCVYIVPVSSAVLDKNTTLPASNGTMTTYNVGGTVYTSTGTWGVLGMANGADAFHTVSPLDYTSAYHSIGWGIDTTDLDVYFSPSQGGRVIYMANSISNDPFNAANFIDTLASEETPGAANNAANAAWIGSMNNGCQPFTPPVVSINTPANLTCIQTSVILTATSPTSNAVYHWSNGTAGATDTVSSSGRYYVTVNDAGGVCQTVDSVNVIQLTTLFSISITELSPLSCINATDTLLASSSVSGLNYNWGGGITTPTNVVTITGNYSVTATDPNSGCTASASITVNATNGLSVSISATHTSCGASNGAATVTLNSGVAQSYAWSNGGTTSTITGLASGTYRVTVDAGGGCTATDSVVINPSGNGSVVLTIDRLIICSGDTAHICVTSVYPKYAWNIGDTTRCINATQAGNYYAAVTDAGNCIINSNHVALNVFPLPPVSISVNGDTLTAYNAVSYQWYRNSVLIPNATSSVYIATIAGSYTVQVADTNSCHATSSAVSVVTGLNDLNADNQLTVYPNPSQSDIIELEVANALLGKSLEVFDASGRLIYNSPLASNHVQLEVELARGVYCIKINSGSKILTRKLIRL
jgi:hypothetical protein